MHIYIYICIYIYIYIYTHIHMEVGKFLVGRDRLQLPLGAPDEDIINNV